MQGITDGIIISAALIMGAYACLMLTIITVVQIMKYLDDRKWRKWLEHDRECLNNLLSERIDSNGKDNN